VRGLALVTGAGHGIGRAIAENLAGRGFDIFMVALHGEELLQKAEDMALRHGVACYMLEIDLTESGACQRVFVDVERIAGDICILVNNAGIGSTAPFLSMPPGFYEKQIQLNDSVPVVLTRLFLPVLLRQQEAWILNISSLGAWLQVPDKAVYGATKAFLHSFSVSLRSSLAGSSVHVCVVSPGPVNTNQRLLVAHSKLRGISARMVMEAHEVAEEALNGMFRYKKLVIPGRLNRLIFWVQRLLPGFVKTAILKSRIPR
jgi:uncharacterized protein